jgi:hypothetical protein
VSNVLNELARAGIVSTGRGFIDVIDLAALRRQAEA